MQRLNRNWSLIVGMIAACVVLIASLPIYAADTITLTTRGVTNVRSGPGTTYSIIGRLGPDESVTATGRDSTSNTWLRIDFDGSEGWISASVVNLNGDPTILDVVSASNAQDTTGNSDVTITLNGSTNIRVGPGTDYPSLGSGASGTTYDVTARSAFDARIVCFGSRLTDILTDETPEDVWLRIDYNGFDAWVNYQVGSVSGNVCDLDEADFEEPDVAEEFEGGVLVVTTSGVNLRASNYRDSEVLAVIPFDTTLRAEARDSDGNRIRVTYDGETGWISTGFIEVAFGDLDDLPVEEE